MYINFQKCKTCSKYLLFYNRYSADSLTVRALSLKKEHEILKIVKKNSTRRVQFQDLRKQHSYQKLLEKEKNPPHGTYADISGWGNKENGETSLFKAAKVLIRSESECKVYFSKFTFVNLCWWI